MKIQNNINLWKKSTIWVWWNAKFYCEINRESEFENARNFAKKNNLWLFFFWIWSNILFSKDIEDKLVCRIKNNFFEKISEDEEFWYFKVWSGTILWNLINILIKENLDLTPLAWFPSTIWWAISWNAGLCNREMKAYLVSAKIFNVETWKFEEWKNEDFEFWYRTSKIKWKNNFIISDCILKIPKSSENLKEKLTKNLISRTEKQPKWRSAWSFFKNHEWNFAWRLIEEVWLKWKKIWWAFFSWKHANFLMTKEWVEIKDILKLKNLAQKKIEDKFWIKLEEEIIIIQ